MNKESVQQIIDVSDKLKVLNVQKLRAQERFESNTIIGHNGGLFKVDSTFLTYINYLLQIGKTSDEVVLDSNNLPTLISNVNEFHKKIQDTYYTALDVYYTDITELNRLKRSVANYIDLGS